MNGTAKTTTNTAQEYEFGPSHSCSSVRVFLRMTSRAYGEWWHLPHQNPLTNRRQILMSHMQNFFRSLSAFLLPTCLKLCNALFTWLLSVIFFVSRHCLQPRICRITKIHYWQTAVCTEHYSASRHWHTHVRPRLVTVAAWGVALSQLLHEELHWLDVPECIQYELKVTVHRSLQNKAPE